MSSVVTMSSTADDDLFINKITWESVGCIFLLVIAYKIYRMKMKTTSNCCRGAFQVEADNPGNDTPKALKTFLGGSEESKGGEESKFSSTANAMGRSIEQIGLTLEEIELLKRARLTRSSNDMISAVEVSEEHSV